MTSLARKPGKYALGFLFITVLMNIIGLGIIIPVMPSLLTELTGKSVSEASLYGGALLFVYAVMQFFMSPILGGISDRYGRRPVILFSLLGYAFDFCLMAMAPNYWWLFLGRAMSGAFAATFATANAYIADISPPEKRAANFGLLGAAFGIGFIVGPAIGGWLGEISPRLPFLGAAAISFLNFLYGLFVLPETLSAENRRAFSWSRANPLGSLIQIAHYKIVLGILLAYFLMQFSHNSLMAVWAYFTELKYGWSPAEVGWSLAFVGLLAALVQGGLSRRAIPALGERRAVLVGAISMVASFIGYALFAPVGAWIYFWLVIGAFGGFMMPAMQGLMSRATPANAQGELQGAIASVMSLTMMTSPLTMTWVFNSFTEEDAPVYFPGAPFLLAAIMLALSMVPFALTMAKARLRERDAPPAPVTAGGETPSTAP